LKTDYTLADCEKVAAEIIEMFSHACERIAVAGSIRRRKSICHDVEILYIPKLSERPDGLFDTAIVSVADEVIEQRLNAGYFSKRPSKIGVFTWGESNKLGIHTASGIPVDLFSTSLEKWWVALVIRTGSRETNLRLTTGANRLNRTLNAYGYGVTDRSTGETTAATSERHVFELCGVPFLEPFKRTF
jgi:DNA polymerase/3'-5' exonuclease PolX